MLQALIASGVDLNVQNKDGETALHAAAKVGNLELVQVDTHTHRLLSIENCLGIHRRESGLERPG